MKSYKVLFLVFFAFSCVSKQNKYLSDAWIGEPDSGFRKVDLVQGKKFMISSGNELASKAGAKILAQGGNTIDAAIAAQMVLNVVEPHSSGIGGGAFLLYYDAKKKKSFFFNGRETAPAKVKSDIFLDKNGQVKTFEEAVKGGASVATPGLLKMLKEVHQKYGKIAWQKLFSSAIEIAENGYVVSQRMNNLQNKITYLKEFDESAKIYLNDKKEPKKIGEIIKNPQLAQTFKIIAKDGIKPFYEGKIAKDIVAAVQNSKINSGFLSLDDLKNYRSKKGNLICLSYRQKYEICTMPMPSGGITLLQILGILENFDLRTCPKSRYDEIDDQYSKDPKRRCIGHTSSIGMLENNDQMLVVDRDLGQVLKNYSANSAEFIHLFSEAARLAYADRSEYVADIKDAPIKQMLDKNYLKNRAKLISFDKKIAQISAGEFADFSQKFANDNSNEPPSTTHMSVVDRDGNAISMTSSIEYFFGSGISVDGFLLNNHLTDFSFIDEVNGKKIANSIAPNKQPRSSMSPSFVFDKKGNLILVVGSPGGPRIIQFVAKAIINYLDFNLDIQQAISAPNFVALNEEIELEKNTPLEKLQKDLQQLGHKTKIIEITSGTHAISVFNNQLQGAADPRREGVAVGF